MADNVTANAGAGGATFASDDIGGIQYARAKLSWGVDGSAVDASATNPLPVVQTGIHTVTGAGGSFPVTDSGGSLTVDNGGTFAVQADAFPSTVHSADFDTGAGTDTTLAFGIAVAADGGAAVITGDTTNGLDVDVTRVGGTVTVDGSGVTQPISAASLPLPTGASTSANQTTIIGHLDGVEGLLTTIDADTSNLSVVGGGTEAAAIRVTIANNSTGVLSVDDNGGALTVDGTIAATQSGTWTVQPGNTANTTPWLVTQTPATSGGLSIFRSIDLDETEEEVKATAGQVFGMWVTNTATATRWIKFYNATAANVTVGTTTPVITWGIPGNSSDDISALFSGTNGIVFGTAITVAATTGVADNDTGAPGANEVIVNIFYK